MNESGERLAEFYALNGLVIGGTLFKYRYSQVFHGPHLIAATVNRFTAS